MLIRNAHEKLRVDRVSMKTAFLLILLCSLTLLTVIGALDKFVVTADTKDNCADYSRKLDSSSYTIMWVLDNSSIQEAINEADHGDTIYVRAGVYHEDIVVNKSLFLVGENAVTTVLDGEGESLLILSVVASDVTVRNFTVKNTRADQPAYGVSIKNSQNVSLMNVTVEQSYTGLVLGSSSNCEIVNNAFIDNYAYGVDLRDNSVNNTIVSNWIVANPTGMLIGDKTCENNRFHHNNFVNNTNQIDVTYGGPNMWDDGNEGNYWSDYTGLDDGSDGRVAGDGVGDTLRPHQNVDYYPLMKPRVPFHPISPIAHFGYSPKTPVAEETVTFNASESYDPDGNITLYFWNFGDGSFSSKPSQKQGYTVNHTYVSAGSYTVNLTVTDNDGLTDSFTEILVVQKMNSTLALNLVPSKTTVGNNVTISGYITPKRVGADVTIYYMFWPEVWKKLATVKTEEPLGNYTYVWTAPRAGEWVILKANWTGDEKTLGAEDVKKVTIEKASSSIMVDVDPENVTVGSNVVISGKINPRRANINVSVQIYRVNETDPICDTTVKTDTNSFYTYVWTPSEIGAYEVKIRWNGDPNTYPAESETKTVNVEVQPPPTQNLLPYAIAAIIVALIVGFIYFFKRKR